MEAQGRADGVLLVTLVKVLAVLMFLYPLLHYPLLSGEQEVASNDSEPLSNESQERILQAEPSRRRVLVEQPSCPLSYLRTVLRELCEELFLQHQQCTPEDVNNLEKHKLPKTAARNNTTGEPRGTIVGCVAAGLLLTSLGAAFFELYKAKSQTPVKAKPPMNRKCSLADLTVLKHNRKELVRRESIMEIPETGGALNKPLGFRPPPLFRRSSFPAGPCELSQSCSKGSRHDSRRTSVEGRRFSIIDSRRSSVDFRQGSRPPSRQTSVDGRAVSFDESPERRHWSRLVHRH